MLTDSETDKLFEKALEITRVANRALDLTESQQSREEIINELKRNLSEINDAILELKKHFNIDINS